VIPQGTGLVYCGYIGGANPEPGMGIAVDRAGNAYVTGSTWSDQQTFPVTVGPELTFNSGGGSDDVFVAKVSLTLLTGNGSTRPGASVSLTLTASDDAGLPFQVGSSLGTGPIIIGNRQLGLSPDGLLAVSAGNLWPAVFPGYRGVIDILGRARTAVHIPNIPALIGTRLHNAFVTLDPAAPSGIKSISNTFSFSITK